MKLDILQREVRILLLDYGEMINAPAMKQLIVPGILQRSPRTTRSLNLRELTPITQPLSTTSNIIHYIRP